MKGILLFVAISISPDRNKVFSTAWFSVVQPFFLCSECTVARIYFHRWDGCESLAMLLQFLSFQSDVGNSCSVASGNQSRW